MSEWEHVFFFFLFNFECFLYVLGQKRNAAYIEYATNILLLGLE